MALMTRLSQCLSPSSTLVTDVRFLFNEGGGVVKEVTAHRLILALISDVFEREFFGSMKEDKYDIPIKDSSQEVFQAMINFIYNKKPDWNNYDLTFLSQLYYLAEKYNIGELRIEIIASIETRQITDENVLDVAILAEENILHQPLSDSLYEVATIFLMKKFDGKLNNAIEFFSGSEASEVHGLVLMKIMARMKNTECSIPLKCKNCKSSPCLDGQGLTFGNFVTGAEVILINGNGHHKIKLIHANDYRSFSASLTDGTTKNGLTLDPLYVAFKCF